MKTFVTFLSVILLFSFTGCTDEADKPKKNPPTLTTVSVSNISQNSAKSGGDVTSDGNAPITARGVVWGTKPSPTIDLSTKTTDGTGTGKFTSDLTDLVENTTYYVRAYATNSEGTSYGNEVIFNTLELTVPIVTTASVTEIMQNGASSGGNVTSDGNSPVTARGVVWGTSPNPTVELNTKSSDGVGLGNFTSKLTNLVENTTYYVRAYATNSVGTGYGNELTFQAVSPFFSLETAIKNKMEEYGIPGVSIAITRNEKLVYLKSLGYADKETNEPISDSSLFRIASISKPITVVAILKLVQDGKISFDQKVFGTNGILGNDFGEVPVGSDKDLITVRHLIEHKSGWTNTPNDPMFLSINFTQEQIIKDVLINRPLTYKPGETYFYSNFGYSVLGRVIEKATQMTYEKYVQTQILNPMGITHMKISGNTLVDRFPNEVKYFQNQFSPYAMNVTRMDSHGGWIASSKDLAKFIVRVDRMNVIPDLLPTSVLNLNPYFGFMSWWHSGALPGTSTVLNRLDNTFNFVILTNTSSMPNYSLLINDLNQTMINQIRLINSWPSEDLFD
jgi:CubicO group peptidase (beta-lactamase class C family)